MKQSALVLALMLLGGCTVQFVKPGSTQQDFNVDSYACQKDTHQSGGFGEGLAGTLNRESFMEQCMLARGWTVKN